MVTSPANSMARTSCANAARTTKASRRNLAEANCKALQFCFTAFKTKDASARIFLDILGHTCISISACFDVLMCVAFFRHQVAPCLGPVKQTKCLSAGVLRVL